MKTVLFLGPGNATRTQMAEAILRHRAGEHFEPCSAGLRPTAVHPMTRQVLAELGVDTSVLEAKSVQRFLGRATVHYAIILSSPEEPDSPRLYPFTVRTLHWPFENPALATGTEQDRLEAFRRVRDLIDSRIGAWLEGELTRQANLVAVA
jgi:arsenate reductase